MRPYRHGRLVVAVVFLAWISACSAQPGPGDASSAASSSSPASSSPTLAPTATTPPSTKTDLPDGTYRTAVTSDLLSKHDSYDIGQAGTWTLVVNGGGYELWCSTDQPQLECGQDEHAGNVMVEKGFLRGPGPTVWFVHDLDWTAKACGGTPSNPACASDGYRMTWQLTDDKLEFSDWFGLGDESGPPNPVNNWTIQPWTRSD